MCLPFTVLNLVVCPLSCAHLEVSASEKQFSTAHQMWCRNLYPRPRYALEMKFRMLIDDGLSVFPVLVLSYTENFSEIGQSVSVLIRFNHFQYGASPYWCLPEVEFNHSLLCVIQI